VPVLLDTSLLCDESLDGWWPLLTEASRSQAAAVGAGATRDFTLQLQKGVHVRKEHVEFGAAHGAASLDILVTPTTHYTSPHIEDHASAQVVQHVGPARKRWRFSRPGRVPPRHAAQPDADWDWDCVLYTTHGDTLFVPGGWGHDVTTICPTASTTAAAATPRCRHRSFGGGGHRSKLPPPPPPPLTQPSNVAFVVGWQLLGLKGPDETLRVWLAAPRRSTRFNVSVDMLQQSDTTMSTSDTTSLQVPRSLISSWVGGSEGRRPNTAATQGCVIARARRLCARGCPRQPGE
jgi:hypothetical protein